MDEFEVEAIQAFRLVDEKLEYLVHWKGYDSDSDTWEPEENLSNCPMLMDKFWEEYTYQDEPLKLDGIKAQRYNGEIVYVINFGERQTVVTKEFLTKHYPKDLEKYLSA